MRRIWFVVCLGMLGAPLPVLAGCWVCDQVAGGTMDCALLEESGGESCSVTCRTIHGVDRCTCRTSGVCGAGGGGCVGPCPQVLLPPSNEEGQIKSELLEQALDRASRFYVQPSGGEDGEHFLLRRQLLQDLEKKKPDVAALLLGLTSNNEFVLGDHKGLMTSTPSNAKDRIKQTRVYKYRAIIHPEANGLAILILVSGHPQIRSISGQVFSMEGWDHLEVVGIDGTVESFRQ